MTLQAKAALAVVDLYLARGRLRAEISMQGFTRLSDLFNNVPGEFIGATMRMSSTGEVSVVRRDLVVRLRDVRLVRPIDERSAPVVLGELRERIPAHCQAMTAHIAHHAATLPHGIPKPGIVRPGMFLARARQERRSAHGRAP